MFFHYDRATRRYRTKITCGTSTLRARSVAYVLYVYITVGLQRSKLGEVNFDGVRTDTIEFDTINFWKPYRPFHLIWKH